MASIGLSPSSLATATAPSGMMMNWATTPMKIGQGRRRISLKSGRVSVSPMHSMMMAIIVETCGASGVKVPGEKKARAEPAKMNAGKAKTAIRAERSSASTVVVFVGLSCCVINPLYGIKFPKCEMGRFLLSMAKLG